MNAIWFPAEQEPGIGAAHAEGGGDPALTAIRNDYRWTPACQRAFLEELACSGSVTRAVAHVGKSARSAYDLRLRREGAAFRLGWDAAILVARAALADVLMDRAINGYQETLHRQEDGTLVRCKQDNRLSMNLLSRLDRMAEAQAMHDSPQAQVQLVSQDFEAFLDLVGKGGRGAEAALFLSARNPADVPEDEDEIDYELERISADFEDEEVPDVADLPPEAAAKRLSVWFDEDDDVWKTDFPPRDAADAAQVSESGLFGDPGYERTLTQEEEATYTAVRAAKIEHLRAAALVAREGVLGWNAGA